MNNIKNFLDIVSLEISNSWNEEEAFMFLQEIQEYTQAILELNTEDNLENLINRNNDYSKNEIYSENEIENFSWLIKINNELDIEEEIKEQLKNNKNLIEILQYLEIKSKELAKFDSEYFKKHFWKVTLNDNPFNKIKEYTKSYLLINYKKLWLNKIDIINAMIDFWDYETIIWNIESINNKILPLSIYKYIEDIEWRVSIMNKDSIYSDDFLSSYKNKFEDIVNNKIWNKFENIVTKSRKSEAITDYDWKPAFIDKNTKIIPKIWSRYTFKVVAENPNQTVFFVIPLELIISKHEKNIWFKSEIQKILNIGYMWWEFPIFNINKPFEFNYYSKDNVKKTRDAEWIKYDDNTAKLSQTLFNYWRRIKVYENIEILEKEDKLKKEKAKYYQEITDPTWKIYFLYIITKKENNDPLNWTIEEVEKYTEYKVEQKELNPINTEESPTIKTNNYWHNDYWDWLN